jgi:hypothetical protein
MTENIIDNLYNLIKKLEKRVRKLEEKESLHEEASVSAGLEKAINKIKQCLICADNSHTIEECIISTNMVCFNCNKKGHLRKACHLQRRISI